MKKVVRIIIIVLLIIALILIGRKIYYNNIEVKPNDLYLSRENSEENIKMNTGSYSWQDKGINVAGVSVSPQDIENLKTLNVKQNEKINFTDCNWTSATGNLLLINEQNTAGFALEINPKEHYIIVPNFEGEYIIQIDLESDKGEVWYAAKLNISK